MKKLRKKTSSSSSSSTSSSSTSVSSTSISNSSNSTSTSGSSESTSTSYVIPPTQIIVCGGGWEPANGIYIIDTKYGGREHWAHLGVDNFLYHIYFYVGKWRIGTGFSVPTGNEYFIGKTPSSYAFPAADEFTSGNSYGYPVRPTLEYVY